MLIYAPQTHIIVAVRLTVLANENSRVLWLHVCRDIFFLDGISCAGRQSIVIWCPLRIIKCFLSGRVHIDVRLLTTHRAILFVGRHL